MDLAWFLLAVPFAGIVFVLVGLRRVSRVDRDRCPFMVGADRIDGSCPCEPHPPCHFV
jgi:hypothetical protein